MCVLIAVNVFVGCEQPPSPVGAASQPVLDGEESPTEDDGVVLVASQGTEVEFVCTGTLVAPNLLLTARHCVSAFEDGSFACTTEGELISTGTAGEMALLYDPSQVHVYVGADALPGDEPAAIGQEIVALNTTTICRNDIALVILDRSLDLPSFPLRLDAPTFPGELVRIVGYGGNDLRTTLRLSRSDVQVLEVGASEFRPEGGATPPRTFAIGQSACQGDSGGPALTDQNAIAGIFSVIQGGDCRARDVRNVYTQVAPYEDLVREGFQRAGAEVWLEGEPAPSAGGAGGASASSVAGNGPRAGAETVGGEAERAGRTDDTGCKCAAAPRSPYPDAALLTQLAVLATVCCRRRRRDRTSPT